MKNFSLIFIILILVSACSKEDKNGLKPCSVSNLGVFFASNSGNNYCTVDSAVLSNKKFKIWFTENTTNQSYESELYRHDSKDFSSGTYYFVTDPNDNNPAFNYPAVNFTIEELQGTSSNNAITMLDRFPVCIQIAEDQDEMGVLIEGMKVFNSSFGYNFLTFSLENQIYLAI